MKADTGVKAQDIEEVKGLVAFMEKNFTTN